MPELWTRVGKLTICVVFIIQSYFASLRNIRLSSRHYFIIKIPNKQKPQQIIFNNPSDINFKEFMNLLKKCTASENPSRFRNNILGRKWKQSW